MTFIMYISEWTYIYMSAHVSGPRLILTYSSTPSVPLTHSLPPLRLPASFVTSPVLPPPHFRSGHNGHTSYRTIKATLHNKSKSSVFFSRQILVLLFFWYRNVTFFKNFLRTYNMYRNQLLFRTKNTKKSRKKDYRRIVI